MLNISIVLYNPDWTQVTNLCEELLRGACTRKIYLVDNSKQQTSNLPLSSSKVEYIWNGGQNLGYGRAHNIAIRQSVRWHTPFHLVINADVWIKAEDLDLLHDFIMNQPAVGMLMPKVVYPNGQLQYLCKLLPTPLDVFGRRFLPSFLTRRRNARYELRCTGYNRPMNVPYLSGCFMLLRTEAVLKARLFDERYFMYPEDIDLTRTIHRDYLTLFYPEVTIVHDHAQASYHSWRMTWVHIVNMCRYFNKWGWFFDRDRRLFNRMVLTDTSQN
ncbi:MAG: glycosyltransferase family 2 protein [Paludibacteraceae bacterium]|nr:glycosyltransferase family 2 protein [Paludibacteraceae bacterium]